MSTIKDFVKRHPVVSYYVVVFTISWGGMLLLAAPGGIPGSPEEVERLFFPALVVMFAGPFLGGLLLTALVSGREGFRGYFSRLIRRRVDGRWYAIALRTGPVFSASTLILQPQTASGHTTWNLLLGIALWVIVLAVGLARRPQEAAHPVAGAAG